MFTAAARLIAKSEICCYGQRLSITSVTPASPAQVYRRWRSEITLHSAKPEPPVDRTGLHGSQTLPSVAVATLDYDRDSDEFSLDSDINNWWQDAGATDGIRRCQSLDPEQCDVNSIRISDTDKRLCGGSSPQRRQLSPDNNAHRDLLETDKSGQLIDDDDDDDDDDGDKNDNCRFLTCELAVTEQVDEMLISQQKPQKPTKLVHELQRNAVEPNTPRSAKRSWKLYFSEEKLCMLEKLIAAGSVDFPCRMRVVRAEDAVELVADEENVTESEIKLYELVAGFSSVPLRLSGGVVKLLRSGRGQRWLQTQLAAANALFHAKDSACPVVIGVDGRASTDAKFLLETILSSRRIPFDDQHATFLRSAQWADAVSGFESAHFVAVTAEYRDRRNEIVVEGSCVAVDQVGGSVELLLRQNSRVQRNVVMSAQQFRLLMQFRVEILDQLKSETASQRQRNG